MKNEFIARFLAIGFHVGSDDKQSIHLAWPNSIYCSFNIIIHLFCRQIHLCITSHEYMNTYQYNWLQNILQISDYDFIFHLLQIPTVFIKYLL